MIKLQDFARECGVTDRAIQKHLKTYAEELDGLYERKGSNGTWLSDEACEILRSKMKQLPPAVIDGQTARENDELKKRVRDLEELLSKKEMLVEMAQSRADALQEKMSQVYALETGQKALEERLEVSESLQKEYKAEAERTAQELSSALAEVNRRREAEKRWAKDVDEANQKAMELARNEREARLEAQRLEKELEEVRAQNRALKNRGFFERLFRKGE